MTASCHCVILQLQSVKKDCCEELSTSLPLFSDPQRAPLTLHGGKFKLCFEGSPLFLVPSIICPHQCRKWVHRRWAQGEEEEGVERANCGANFKTHTLSKKLLQAVHDYEYKLSVTSLLFSFLVFSSLQRPYVMRSSTPANEILQTFHKVHPSYPAAWSLEMKSLLRKVNECIMYSKL